MWLLVTLLAVSLSSATPPPGRLRRQLEFNASVPYIFSARLYPFGADRGDLLVQRDIEPYALEHPVNFLGEQHDSIYVSRPPPFCSFFPYPEPSTERVLTRRRLVSIVSTTTSGVIYGTSGRLRYTVIDYLWGGRMNPPSGDEKTELVP